MCLRLMLATRSRPSRQSEDRSRINRHLKSTFAPFRMGLCPWQAYPLSGVPVRRGYVPPDFNFDESMERPWARRCHLGVFPVGQQEQARATPMPANWQVRKQMTNRPGYSIKRFIASCICLCLFSIMSALCAGNAGSYSLPKWFLNPPKNNHDNLFGVGQGMTVEDATKEALNQVASKISVTISSNWEKTESQRTSGGSIAYSKEINNNLKSKVAEIRFNNYEVLDNDILDQKVYVLVAVNKNTLLMDKKSELSNIDSQIKDIYNMAQSKSIIEKIADLKTVNRKAVDGMSLASMISSLDPSFAAKDYFDRYNGYLASERKALSEIRVYLSYAHESEDMMPIIKEHLNKADISIVSEPNDNDKNLVTVDIQTDSKEMQIYGSKMVKLYTIFEVRSFSRDLVASSKIETKGSSMINFQEAGKAAALELNEKIKVKGILNVLGINRDID